MHAITCNRYQTCALCGQREDTSAHPHDHPWVPGAWWHTAACDSPLDNRKTAYAYSGGSLDYVNAIVTFLFPKGQS